MNSDSDVLLLLALVHLGNNLHKKKVAKFDVARVTMDKVRDNGQD